jgi:hypothetical protein
LIGSGRSSALNLFHGGARAPAKKAKAAPARKKPVKKKAAAKKKRGKRASRK